MNVVLAEPKTQMNRETSPFQSGFWQSMRPKGGSGSITAGSFLNRSVDISKEFAQESKLKRWTVSPGGNFIAYFELKQKPQARAHRKVPRIPAEKRSENCNPSFPDLLADLNKQIDNLSHLPMGWDGEDALPINSETCLEANKFLLLHLSEFLKSGHDTSLPKVKALPDGTIDLFWKTPAFRFLVNIPFEKNIPSTFFGEYFGETRARGSVEPGKICSLLIDYLNRE